MKTVNEYLDDLFISAKLALDFVWVPTQLEFRFPDFFKTVASL